MIGTYETDRYHFLEMAPLSVFQKTGSNRWRTDSLQEHGLNGRWPEPCFSSAFGIEGDHLIHLHKGNPDIEGDYRVFTRLKKIQD